VTGRPRTERRGERLEHGYEAIAAELREKIKDGTYPVGDRLPTKAELMELYGVSLNTVDHAIRELRKEGLAEPRQGRGTYVTAPPPKRPGYADLVKAVAELTRTVDLMGTQLDTMQDELDSLRIGALAAREGSGPDT
jgi:DNA-binding GntR family transcriptional regulator